MCLLLFCMPREANDVPVLRAEPDTGFFSAGTDAVMMKDEAVALRVRIVARLRSLGCREQADRLL